MPDSAVFFLLTTHHLLLMFFCPPDPLMHPLVPAGRHNTKILRVVVLLVAVYMMYHASLVYLAADLFLRCSPMFILPLAFVIEVLDIPVINARLRPLRFPPHHQIICDPSDSENGEDGQVD